MSKWNAFIKYYWEFMIDDVDMYERLEACAVGCRHTFTTPYGTECERV